MYYLLFALLYPLSLLPLRVLYLLSDFAYFLICKVFGYRKKVVLQNLTIAFPNKTEAEREAIAKQFYHNFMDTFVETIKFISASPAFFRKHFTGDFSRTHEVYKDGRSIQFHIGHNFNWELVNLAMPFHLPDKFIAVYMPLHSKPADRLFRYIRSRFGTRLAAATNLGKDMLPYRGKQYILGLLADQSPPIAERAYWVKFFNRPTAFLKTPEAAARRNNFPVFFAHFTKLKRGYYQGHVELATENPAALPAGQLTKMYAEYLEHIMTAYPEMWLWSHRRWKKEWKPEYGLIE